jgi:hypothetical protein
LEGGSTIGAVTISIWIIEPVRDAFGVEEMEASGESELRIITNKTLPTYAAILFKSNTSTLNDFRFTDEESIQEATNLELDDEDSNETNEETNGLDGDDDEVRLRES